MARRCSGGGGGGGGGGASEAAVYAATVADWERHQAALCQRCIFPGCPNPPDRGQRKDGAGRRRACCPAHAKRYQTMPPREIPLAMLPAYSMGGRVKIVYDHAKYSWRNESGLNAGLHWSKAYMDEYAKQYSPDRIRRSRRGPSPGVRPWWTDEQYRPTYGGLEAYDVFMALDRHGVKGGKRVAVVGSLRAVRGTDAGTHAAALLLPAHQWTAWIQPLQPRRAHRPMRSPPARVGTQPQLQARAPRRAALRQKRSCRTKLIETWHWKQRG